MDTKRISMFILNGFYSSYVNEWFDLYKRIEHFIFYVYQQYCHRHLDGLYKRFSPPVYLIASKMSKNRFKICPAISDWLKY